MAKISNTAASDTFGTWLTNANKVADRISQFAVTNSSLYANTIIANVAFTSTGLATLSGRATVGTNLTVSGNTTLGAAGKTITSTGALSHTGTQTISTNLTVSGNTSSNKSTVTSSLTVSGNTTLGGAGKTITSTGALSHTGTQTISTNLTVSGNTTISGLIANGAIGTSNYVLKTNGTTAFWAPAAGGVTTWAGGSTGLTPAGATSGAVTLAGTLAVGSGGTGGSTSTGSGAVVLATNPALVGYTVNTASGVDGEWTTAGLTVYANAVTPQHDAVLHVMNASAGSVSSISGSVATFEGSSTTYVNILTPNASSGLYNFGNPANNNAAYLAWNYDGNLMSLATNKAGASIKFQTAAGADALTLDSSQRAVFVGQIRGAAGSAAAPQYSYSGSTSTGHYMLDVGGGTINLNASIIGVQASKYSSAGAAITFTRYTVTADSATGSPMRWESSTGTQGEIDASTTTSITTAKEIMDVQTDRSSALIMVAGSTSSSVYFSDIIHFQSGIAVISARTTGAAARTYSLESQGHVKVAMASGSYTVIANGLRSPLGH